MNSSEVASKVILPALITPLLALILGLIAEPIQRRSGKARLEYLERRINLGKTLLELGNAGSLEPSASSRVKRELRLLYRQCLLATQQNKLQAKRDRDVIYWYFSRAIPPRPRTLAGAAFTLVFVYITGAIALAAFLSFFVSIGMGYVRMGASEAAGNFGSIDFLIDSMLLVLSLLVSITFFFYLYVLMVGYAVVMSQTYVVNQRRRKVPSLATNPWTMRAWVGATSIVFIGTLPAWLRSNQLVRGWERRVNRHLLEHGYRMGKGPSVRPAPTD